MQVAQPTESEVPLIDAAQTTILTALVFSKAKRPLRIRDVYIRILPDVDAWNKNDSHDEVERRLETGDRVALLYNNGLICRAPSGFIATPRLELFLDGKLRLDAPTNFEKKDPP